MPGYPQCGSIRLRKVFSSFLAPDKILIPAFQHLFLPVHRCAHGYFKIFPFKWRPQLIGTDQDIGKRFLEFSPIGGFLRINLNDFIISLRIVTRQPIPSLARFQDRSPSDTALR